jgi:hypothetical protein
MITDRTFDHDEDEDFTRDFTASIDQDYITLFIYSKRDETSTRKLQEKRLHERS